MTEQEELDLFLTRKLVDLLPGSVIKKHIGVAGERYPIFYLYVPGKERMLLGRGFKAAAQAVKLYRDNLQAEKASK